MESEAFLVIALASFIALLAWNIVLLRQNDKLMNKLMSRNYAEYAQSESFLKREPEPEDEAEPEDPYDEQRAREINGIMGMGS